MRSAEYEEWTRMHINVREFLTAVVAVGRAHAAAGAPQGVSIPLWVDNNTALYHIRKRNAKGSHGMTTRYIAHNLAAYLMENDLELDVQWIPSAENCIADALSRRYEADTQPDSPLTLPPQTWMPSWHDFWGWTEAPGAATSTNASGAKPRERNDSTAQR